APLVTGVQTCALPISKRFGFTVKTIPQVHPHPGPEAFVDAATKAITPATRVLAFTHLTSTVGDLFPAKELCRVARERGVLTLVEIGRASGRERGCSCV